MDKLIKSLIKSAEDRETNEVRVENNLAISHTIARLFPKEEVDKIPIETRYPSLVFAFLDAIPENRVEALRPFQPDIFNIIYIYSHLIS